MRSRNGFTLIEAAVIVTILVLLAGVVVPIVSHHVGEARTTRAQADMKIVSDAFHRYLSHTGAWPTSESGRGEELVGFACLYQNTGSRKGWNGPYMSLGVRAGSSWAIATPADGSGPAAGLVDPWGRTYRLYRFPAGDAMGDGGGMVLLSAGENGTVDTPREQIAEGAAGGDDVVFVVARRL